MIELYRCYDKDDVLLYVGISLSAARRLAAHRRKAGWFGSIRTIKIKRYGTRERALSVELRAIQEEKPLWNVAGTSNVTPPPRTPKKRRIYRYELPLRPLSQQREPGRLTARQRETITRREIYSPKVEEAYQELMAAFSQTDANSKQEVPFQKSEANT